LLVLAYPPFAQGWLAWFALVPLLASIRNSGGAAAFAFSFFAGTLFFLACYAGILAVDGVKWGDYLLLGTYLGLYVGVFGFAYVALLRATKIASIPLVPSLWVSMEYAWSNAPILGLPLAGLGYTQYQSLHLIQISDLTGQYGVSFVLVMVNAAITEALSSSPGARRSLLLALAVLTGSLLYGYSLRDEAKSYIRVTVVQGNIAQQDKWKEELLRRHLEKLIALTREADKAQHASLVIWPESSVPLAHDPALMRSIFELADQTGSSIVTGSAAAQGREAEAHPQGRRVPAQFPQYGLFDQPRAQDRRSLCQEKTRAIFRISAAAGVSLASKVAQQQCQFHSRLAPGYTRIPQDPAGNCDLLGNDLSRPDPGDSGKRRAGHREYRQRGLVWPHGSSP